jgi:hypothetical protein
VPRYADGSAHGDYFYGNADPTGKAVQTWKVSADASDGDAILYVTASGSDKRSAAVEYGFEIRRPGRCR